MADEQNPLLTASPPAARPPNPLADPQGYITHYLAQQGRSPSPQMAAEMAAQPRSEAWMRPYLGPAVSDFLAGALQYGSMLPLGARTGTVMGNDAVMANRINQRARRMPDDTMPVTGGSLRYAEGEFPHGNSAYGLMMRNHESVLPATQGRDLAPYYPARQDYPTAVNENLPPQMRLIPGGRAD